MKNMLLAITVLMSCSAFAAKDSIVFPHVYNNRYSVQIQVWNNTDKNVTCSGSVNMTMDDNSTQTHYYFDTVMPRFTRFETIYPRSSSDVITFVNHSIWCR